MTNTSNRTDPKPTPAITAAEAKQLAAAHNARPPDISPWLDYIHYQIREAAGTGQTALRDPFGGSGCPTPSEPEVAEITAVLKGEGYRIRFIIESLILEGRCCLFILWD